MKILIDIGHPAHVHLFKHFTWMMQKSGHQILFTTRDKEVAVHLLKVYGFQNICLGKPLRSVYGKLLGLIKFNLLLIKITVRFKPDIFLSAGSMYAAQVAWLLRKPHIVLEDTGNMEQVRLYKPFSQTILVSTAFHKDLGKKQFRYHGYHELAYLHPNYYHPDNHVFELLNIKHGEPYIIIRFVSWSASHDVNQSGISPGDKLKIIEELSKHVKVFVSSESQLPEDLSKFRMDIPPEKIHDALAFATLYIGEGATMASECAMLGTPAIYVNSIPAGTIDEQEKYGLIYSFKNSEGVLGKALVLLRKKNLREIHQKNREKMLSEKIDVTDFLVRFIQNYPESKKSKYKV